jgi:mono/diheme cytochrome c family protein
MFGSRRLLVCLAGMSVLWLAAPGAPIVRGEEGLAHAISPWDQEVPPGGHANSFIAEGQSPSQVDRQGRLLLLNYPATETTIGAPYYAISRFYDRVDHKPLLRRAMNRRGYSDIGQSWSYIYGRTGLSFYPAAEGSGAYYLPFPGGGRPAAPIGFSLFHHAQGTPAFTLSCAACHTRNLFGRPVLGASNIHGGVGSSLLLLKKFSGLRPREFRFASRPTGAETRTFHDMQVKASYIHGTQPLAMGLENPASVVGLSLAGRAPDSQATRDPRFAGGAYRSPLWSIPADTKPAPWWTLRYKNRFLLDGSMQGDPVLGQFIFNEIGRGADLAHLQSWIDRNRESFRAMNGAILAMEAPRWTDFFAAESVNLEMAKRGEQIFNQRCADCHGHYEKAWNGPQAGELSRSEQLATTLVVPPAQTQAVDVGTDPNRAQIMLHLAPQLNRLDIFRRNGFKFEAHPGAYVPPPLVGIWARWPYMHNNSIPNLDELLKPAAERVSHYYVGTANDIQRDYDAQAVGFPVGAKTPPEWQVAGRLFDARRAGLRNTGHDEGIFATGGKSDLVPEDKAALIEFLKTL